MASDTDPAFLAAYAACSHEAILAERGTLRRRIVRLAVDAARPVIERESRLSRDQAMRMILDLGSSRVQQTDAVAIKEIVDLLIP